MFCDIMRDLSPFSGNNELKLVMRFVVDQPLFYTDNRTVKISESDSNLSGIEISPFTFSIALYFPYYIFFKH